MKKSVLIFILFSSLALCSGLANAGVDLKFPAVPSPEDIPSAKDMIKDAQVEKKETDTDGFKVTDPDGNVFYVDDIDDPKNVVYGIYIDVDTGSSLGSNLEVYSDIEIGEICFDNC